MKIDSYIDFSREDISNILKEYVGKLGYTPKGEVFFPGAFEEKMLVTLELETFPNNERIEENQCKCDGKCKKNG